MSCCGRSGAYLAKEDSFTLLDAMRASVRGDYASDEEKRRREEICYGCDRHFAPTDTCLECGCIMPLKRMFREATCILGRW